MLGRVGPLVCMHPISNVRYNTISVSVFLVNWSHMTSEIEITEHVKEKIHAFCIWKLNMPSGKKLQDISLTIAFPLACSVQLFKFAFVFSWNLLPSLSCYIHFQTYPFLFSLFIRSTPVRFSYCFFFMIV